MFGYFYFLLCINFISVFCPFICFVLFYWVKGFIAIHHVWSPLHSTIYLFRFMLHAYVSMNYFSKGKNFSIKYFIQGMFRLTSMQHSAIQSSLSCKQVSSPEMSFISWATIVRLVKLGNNDNPTIRGYPEKNISSFEVSGPSCPIIL